MNKLSKTNRQKIKYLLPTGILYLIVGLGCLAILFKGIANDSSINLLFAILGIIAGYISIMNLDPGGSITFSYFNRLGKTKTEDEEELYSLVIKYRNKTLIILTTLSILSAVSYIYISNSYLPLRLSANNIVWLLFWNFLTVGLINTGVKYISVWWNIRNK